jgi:hypothetical protein
MENTNELVVQSISTTQLTYSKHFKYKTDVIFLPPPDNHCRGDLN